MVFTEILAMGFPLPVLPVRVHDTLGFGSFVVGLAIGAQSWVTLLTGLVSGTRSDRHGPRYAAILGLAVSVLAATMSALSPTGSEKTVSKTKLSPCCTSRHSVGVRRSVRYEDHQQSDLRRRTHLGLRTPGLV